MANSDMKGKICLVTGASSGIGRATALGLAKMGATVVLAARNESKGKAAQTEIKAESGNSSIDLMVADLSSQASTRQLAKDFAERYRRLDVLVNNAGGIQSKRIMTEDNLETTWAVNYLGPFLLTNLLAAKLKSNSPARIINVVTRLFKSTKLNFDNLQGEQRFSGFGAYSQAKLAEIIFTYEMARRLEGSGVTVNCVHPGITRSNFGLDTMPGFVKALNKPFRVFNSTPEKAAERILYLATAPELENVSGKYFADRVEIKSPTQSYDLEVAKRLWKVSEQQTGLKNT